MARFDGADGLGGVVSDCRVGVLGTISLMAQGLHGVDAGGAPGGEVAGEQGGSG